MYSGKKADAGAKTECRQEEERGRAECALFVSESCTEDLVLGCGVRCTKPGCRGGRQCVGRCSAGETRGLGSSMESGDGDKGSS